MYKFVCTIPIQNININLHFKPPLSMYGHGHVFVYVEWYFVVIKFRGSTFNKFSIMMSLETVMAVSYNVMCIEVIAKLIVYYSFKYV